MKYTAAEVKKAIVAFVGFALTVLAACLAYGGILPDSWLPFVNVALGLGGTYGVFQARNFGPKGADPTKSIAQVEPPA